MNISRQSGYLTGMVGYDRNNGYMGINGTTEQEHDRLNQYGNFRTAYKNIDGSNDSMLLNRPDYTNQNTSLHNNIRQTTLSEQKFINDIFVYAQFRNIDKYHNPFKFDTKFNGVPTVTEQIILNTGGHVFSYNKYVDGDPQIVLNLQRAFKNIIAVTVNVLIMPVFTNYKFSDGEYVIDFTNNYSERNRFLVLKIKEIEFPYKYTNIPGSDKGYFVLRHDTTRGNNEYWVPMCATLTYHVSNLQNIDRMSFEVLNEVGEQLSLTLNGVPYDFTGEYIQMINYFTTKKNGNSTPIPTPEDIKKMESLKRIVNATSPAVSMYVDTLKAQIDTIPSFINT